MASNGFAPPLPRPATVESVETANLKTSSSPSSSNAVVAFHTRLIEELLADLRTLAPRRPAHQGEPLAEALSKADSWASLRILLRAKLGPPGVALLNGDVETFTATAQVVLAALDRIGAAQLARECGDLDDQNASRTDASGSSAADDGARWHGLCDLLAWLSAVRSAFVGETAPIAPDRKHIAPTAAVKVERKSSRSPVVSPKPSFGFAPPPQPGQLAQKHEDQPTKVNVAAPTPALPGQPTSPPDNKAMRDPAVPAAAPVVQEQPPRPSVAPASVPVPAAGSKAAAFAMRMSGLSGPPAIVADGAAPIASTSALPTGPPSAGFAPPPAPGASAFDRKPKARVRKPRVSAPAAAAGADETRPTRERKISVKIRDASTSNGGDSPPEESASHNKGKKRFTSYDEPSESEHDDDGELDELASDYEEQLERKRRKLDGSGGSGSDASSKKPPRPRATAKPPRDPAAEKARRLALLAKEEAELAQDPKRFKVGQAVIARFPNYSYWPAMVLDPLTAPPKTQGTRVKGAYLVKSIPTGADHRWVPPDDSSILPVTTTQLDDIILGRYKSAPPPSWKKWRGELVDAAMMIKDEARLKEWAAHPTPTELWHIAQAERKKAARASAAW